MPRRIKTKTTRNAAQNVARRIIAKKTKTSPAGFKLSHKEMRFSVSLVILMGMLTFSLMLFLFSLNKSSVVSAETYTKKIVPIKSDSGLKKTGNQTLNDDLLDFSIAVPSQIGDWFYKTGEVKSLTDDSISNQYLRIFIPFPGKKSNNFDQQNKNILTIRKFSADEWSDIEKNCQKENICDAAGKMIAKNTDSNDDEWVYAYTRSEDCPKSIEAKCNFVDKIIESFRLK
jgi:hypothetical protein